MPLEGLAVWTPRVTAEPTIASEVREVFDEPRPITCREALGLCRPGVGVTVRRQRDTRVVTTALASNMA